MITIEIYGHVASGKTTLAEAIEKLLRDNGFSNIDQEDYDICRGSVYSDLDKRLDAIKDREICIRTININRSPL